MSNASERNGEFLRFAVPPAGRHRHERIAGHDLEIAAGLGGNPGHRGQRARRRAQPQPEAAERARQRFGWLARADAPHHFAVRHVEVAGGVGGLEMKDGAQACHVHTPLPGREVRAAGGRAFGAGLRYGLDSFAVEPMPVPHPFQGERGFILSPHIGGVTHDAYVHMGVGAARNVLAVLAESGQPAAQ
jgi:hypothetical protein